MCHGERIISLVYHFFVQSSGGACKTLISPKMSPVPLEDLCRAKHDYIRRQTRKLRFKNPQKRKLKPKRRKFTETDVDALDDNHIHRLCVICCCSRLRHRQWLVPICAHARAKAASQAAAPCALRTCKRRSARGALPAEATSGGKSGLGGLGIR